MEYRMIIADDEPKIIQLIRQLGHWEELGISIIDECCDGEIAFKSIVENKPDFVLSDIKMPVYDGIQLIEKTREQNLDTLFILLSGYRHFDYARNAIQLNVMDYLLKPIDEKQLNETLEKVCRRIDQIREQREKYHKMEVWEEERGEEERKEFWEVLTGKRLKDAGRFEKLEEEECNRIYHTNFKQGYYQVICTVSNLNGMLELNESLFSEKIKGFIYDSFQKFAGVQYNTSFQGHIIILNFPEEQKSNIKNAISALFYNIRELNEIYGNFQFNIGCSNMKNSCSQLMNAFTEASVAEWGRLIFLGNNITEYQQIARMKEFKLEDFISPAKVNALADCIRYLREEEMSDIFSEIYHRAERYNNSNPKSMRNTFNYLYDRILPEIMNEEVREKLARNYYYAYLEAKNFQHIFKNLFLVFDKYVEEEHKKLKEKLGKPLGMAVHFISKHYMEQISQEDVAAAANVSSTYLSKLFKEEMNMGFSEYLTEVRMEEAKKLLSETNISIKEIAGIVGYIDEKYFSKTFKKVNGIKPTDYRRLYG